MHCFHTTCFHPNPEFFKPGFQNAEVFAGGVAGF